MAAKTHTFQAPKGTRDFYPQDLAVRRYIESVWRQTAISHGFDEIDGPTFEHLELYTTKSGPGIVSELFSFKRDKGDTDYALRPEFTPTLARMYAAQAGSLPKPTKWFSIGPYFRAERPQRGRLREHIQLNVDVIGDDSPSADAEVIVTCLKTLSNLGLDEKMVQVKLSDRRILESWAEQAGIKSEKYQVFLWVYDNFDKLSEDEKQAQFDSVNITNKDVEKFKKFIKKSNELQSAEVNPVDASRELGVKQELLESLLEVQHLIDSRGFSKWWSFDSSIVRGLAYYTGTVFEIHETTGKERAIAGGGRYDKLIELFNGPTTAACGFAMGDVVLRLVLEDHGLLKPAEQYMPAPDVFVINARDEEPRLNFVPLVANLRSAGLHVRHSYKSTRNVGKLLSEANKTRSRFAVILGQELDEGKILLKDLKGGIQEDIDADKLLETLQEKLAACEGG